MRRGLKITLGVATVLPVVYIVLFVTGIVGASVFSAVYGTIHINSRPDAFILGLIIAHTTLIVLSFCLTILYVFLALRLIPRSDSSRLPWILAILFGGVIGQLIFFIARVWPEPIETGVAHA